MSGAFVYRTYDADGRLLYVGCTTGLDHRMRAHHRDSPWWLFHTLVEVERFDTRAAALAEELRLIQTEYPRWNVRDRAADHPDGPIHSRFWAAHLREEVEAWREYQHARDLASRRTRYASQHLRSIA